MHNHQTGSPKAGLVLDAAGNLYGTTFIGDDNPGSAFRLAPDGTYTILHDFSGAGDGESPIGSLVADANGHLFGMTSAGGGLRGCGTVFPGRAPTAASGRCTCSTTARCAAPIMAAPRRRG